MDPIQEQIASLNFKVDGLHNMIDELSGKVSESLSEVLSECSQRHQPEAVPVRPRFSYRSSFDTSMEHKDVLADNDFLDSDSHTGERSLAPEVQIQRLTAQLTAAYNRIAALEEQLLSKRTYS
jgi:hypothetical protein